MAEYQIKSELQKSKHFLKFVLSMWDDVVGPRVVKQWDSSIACSVSDTTEIDEIATEPSEVKFSSPTSTRLSHTDKQDKISHYIATHTVIGESLKLSQMQFDTVRETCLSVRALNFISQSAIFFTFPFCFDGNMEPCMYSFSIAVAYDYENLFWNLQPFFAHLTSKISNHLRFCLSRDCSLAEDKKLKELITEAEHQILFTFQNCYKIHTDYLLQKSNFCEITIPWAVAISALLTTGGNTCVIGASERTINKVIDVLALFLPSQAMQQNSRYARANARFCTGLSLQGLVDIHGRRDISASDIFLNELPVTFVDLTRKGLVKFSGCIFEHRFRKERQLRQEEMNILEGNDPELLHTTENQLRPYKEPSRFVVWCLEQLNTQNVQKWEKIIRSFHRALLLKAAKVIALAKQLQPKFCGTGGKNGKLATKLRKTLQITEPDFWLLTATAEQLQPGVSNIFAHV